MTVPTGTHRWRRRLLPSIAFAAVSLLLPSGGKAETLAACFYPAQLEDDCAGPLATAAAEQLNNWIQSGHEFRIEDSDTEDERRPFLAHERTIQIPDNTVPDTCEATAKALEGKRLAIGPDPDAFPFFAARGSWAKDGPVPLCSRFAPCPPVDTIPETKTCEGGDETQQAQAQAPPVPIIKPEKLNPGNTSPEETPAPAASPPTTDANYAETASAGASTDQQPSSSSEREDGIREASAADEDSKTGTEQADLEVQSTASFPYKLIGFFAVLSFVTFGWAAYLTYEMIKLKSIALKKFDARQSLQREALETLHRDFAVLKSDLKQELVTVKRGLTDRHRAGDLAAARADGANALPPAGSDVHQALRQPYPPTPIVDREPDLAASMCAIFNTIVAGQDPDLPFEVFKASVGAGHTVSEGGPKANLWLVGQPDTNGARALLMPDPDFIRNELEYMTSGGGNGLRNAFDAAFDVSAGTGGDIIVLEKPTRLTWDGANWKIETYGVIALQVGRQPA